MIANCQYLCFLFILGFKSFIKCMYSGGVQFTKRNIYKTVTNECIATMMLKLTFSWEIPSGASTFAPGQWFRITFSLCKNKETVFVMKKIYMYAFCAR